MQPDDLDALVRSARRRPMYVPAPEHRVELGLADVERLIPHRPPFRFVDAIDAVDRDGGHIAGRLRLDPDDPLFRGHFPGDPIFPGALQLEACGQLALCLLALLRGDTEPRAVRALKVHHAVFLDAVRPGEVGLVARTLFASDYTSVCAGQVFVGETIACVAVMETYLVET